MPEYLAPGVYVEEVSFRSKSIEGVSTSTAAFVGPTLSGPTAGEPELLTSFADFQRTYGGLYPLTLGDAETPNFVAHAVRAFFDNGGARLYVARVYQAPDDSPATDGRASAGVGASPAALTLRARFPGSAGNLTATFLPRFTANVRGSTGRLSGLRENDVVFVKAAGDDSPPQEGYYDVTRNPATGDLELTAPGGGTLLPADLTAGHRVHIVTLTVRVLRPGRFEQAEDYEGLAPHPGARNSVFSLFTEEPESRRYALTIPFALEPATTPFTGADLMESLFPAGGDGQDALSRSLSTDLELASFSPDLDRPRTEALGLRVTLEGGSDGINPPAPAYVGAEVGSRKTGLLALEDVEDVSIVATPGATFGDTDGDARSEGIVQALLSHCERMRYRVAVLDAPNDQTVGEVRAFRGQFDSRYAALYYPWVTVIDPLDPDGRRELDLPPSGFVTGIYARNDVERGVFKAPANEVVRGAVRFETLLNKAQQDVLNPDGVNCLRFFEGRGYRVWGARTISSDPEVKYISVRRYLCYLERSIDRGTQWAVFEPNGDSLWENVRNTVQDFLFAEWRTGALLGTRPEEAFFVRCDRSTMTQNDLDNGRLVCLIGVAIVKPAEFVIFRIGQWTGDRRA